MIRLQTKQDKVKIIFYVALILLAIIYGISRAYPLIRGAQIVIYYPVDGQLVASTTFQISGRVIRAKEIKVQGQPITIDNQGNFTETLVASPPYTIIVIEATDKYDGKIIKTLRVIPSP